MTQGHISTEPHDASQTPGHEHHEPHVLPISVYLAVWAALVILTAVTVIVSRFDFGSANTLIALLVATIKGSLVALFFMHLYYDNKLNLIILVSSLLFVSIFFTPTLIDLATRGALDPLKGRHYFKMYTAQPVPMPAAPAPTAAAPAPAAPTPAAPAGEHPATVLPTSPAGEAMPTPPTAHTGLNSPAQGGMVETGPVAKPNPNKPITPGAAAEAPATTVPGATAPAHPVPAQPHPVPAHQ